MLKQHKATPGWLPSPTGLPCWAAGQYSTAPLAKAPSGQPRPDVHLCPQLPPLPWVNSALKHLVTRSLKLGEAPPSSPTSKASPFHRSHVCVFVWGEGKLFIFICLMLISVNTKKKNSISGSGSLILVSGMTVPCLKSMVQSRPRNKKAVISEYTIMKLCQQQPAYSSHLFTYLFKVSRHYQRSFHALLNSLKHYLYYSTLRQQILSSIYGVLLFL